MQSESLVLPVLLKDKAEGPYFTELACSTSSPTKLLSWGLDGAGQESHDEMGAAMGCEDGSVYLFSVCVSKKEVGAVDVLSAKRNGSTRVALTIQTPPSPSHSTAPSNGSPRSRHTSHSMHVPHLLSQPKRARVTSSISKASAEAPKSYVDFEEEKERLEDIIKNGPPVKEKSITDGLKAAYAIAGLGFGRDEHVGHGADQQRSNKRVSFPRSSPPTSGTPRHSLSSPPSRSSFSSMQMPEPLSSAGFSRVIPVGPRLTLKSHLFLSRVGSGHKVVALRHLPSEMILCLRESGLITVISIKSGLSIASLELESSPCLQPPPSASPGIFTGITSDPSVWMWKSLQILEMPESIIILALASDQASVDNEGDTESHTRVSILQLQVPVSQLSSPMTSRHGVLHKVGEWIMKVPAESIGLFCEGTTSTPNIFYLSSGPSSVLVSHTLQIVPPAFAIAAPASLQPSPDTLSSTSSTTAAAPSNTPLSNISLPIPNPFRPKSPEIEGNHKTAGSTPGRIIVGPAVTLGPVPVLQSGGCIRGIHLWKTGDNSSRGVLWNEIDFALFEMQGNQSISKIIASRSHRGLFSVERLGKDMFVLHQKHRMDIYQVSLSQEYSIEHVSSRTFSKQHGVATVISPSLLLCSRPKTDANGTTHRRLAYTPLRSPGKSPTSDDETVREDSLKSWNAWYFSFDENFPKSARRVTSLLPLEIDMIILGYNDGRIGRSSFSDLLSLGWPTPPENTPAVNGFINSLHLVQNRETNEKLIVGGLDDGGIAIWDLSQVLMKYLEPLLTLRARWTIFTEPLQTVIQGDAVDRLKGCLLCVSADGTIAMISVDGFELLYLVPAAAAQLQRICLGDDNLLLIYADGKARLWDVKTQEFWRSMTSKAAEELLQQGGWFQTDIHRDASAHIATSLATAQKSFFAYDAASTLLVDVRMLNDLIFPLPSAYVFRDPRREDAEGAKDPAPANASSFARASRRLKLLKALLGSLLSFGLDDAIDGICREKLGLERSLAVVGLFSAQSKDSGTTSLSSANTRQVWQISHEHTASRLLTLITMLRGLLPFDEEYEQYASQVITFYVASLPDAIGPLWRPPSLSFYAQYWFHSSSEIRLAARALFGAAAGRLSDSDIIQLAGYWQHELPCLQPDAEKQSDFSAMSLLIAGNLAIERYAVFEASTLTDIAKSITLYLHDETCPHRALAIDLCSRGFQIWQNYVDAMEVLRALFMLSTSPEKERNVGPQARLAVLQIASTNTPLFMTTLSLDILHPRSVQQRKSIMQLIALLIRKKPLVLHPNLPRLIEAVVKSLDPTSSGDRDAVFDTATEILGLVVKTFPCVDFHMQTQRLCVGTSEGAVIMYDLKTATRLYVLEGHHRRLDACSFSGDGRRLATVSLEEGLACVWKVGSSITSLFMPGAPPRQGHAGSDPFKTLNFNVGDDSHMSVAATLELVRFEWPADRTARLKIRDNTFTFST